MAAAEIHLQELSTLCFTEVHSRAAEIHLRKLCFTEVHRSATEQCWLFSGNTVWPPLCLNQNKVHTVNKETSSYEEKGVKSLVVFIRLHREKCRNNEKEEKCVNDEKEGKV